MAKTERQKLRFTAKRTGKEQMQVPGIGVISKGQEIEVDAEVAERYLAVRGPNDESDWTVVGEQFKVDEEAAAAKDLRQAERAADRASEEAPAEKK